VWIPRYAYKIIYFGDTTNPNKTGEENANAYRISPTANPVGLTGYSTVYGIIDTNGKVEANTNPNIAYKVVTEGYTDYIPHPAFLGTGYENLGGGFGEDNRGVRGFWVAKYEMSMEDENGGNVETVTTGIGGNSSIGNVVANNGANKAVSKPNVTSWRWIVIANMYNNSKNYGTNVGQASYDSHLMKNSEWRCCGVLGTQ